MPQFIGEKEVRVTRRGETFDAGQRLAPRTKLDPVLRLKLAEFASFLDEIEDCSQNFRVDQLEQIITQAVMTCGFGSSGEARQALEWMFHQPLDLS